MDKIPQEGTLAEYEKRMFERWPDVKAIQKPSSPQWYKIICYRYDPTGDKYEIAAFSLLDDEHVNTDALWVRVKRYFVPELEYMTIESHSWTGRKEIRNPSMYEIIGYKAFKMFKSEERAQLLLYYEHKKSIAEKSEGEDWIRGYERIIRDLKRAEQECKDDNLKREREEKQ